MGELIITGFEVVGKTALKNLIIGGGSVVTGVVFTGIGKKHLSIVVRYVVERNNKMFKLIKNVIH